MYMYNYTIQDNKISQMKEKCKEGFPLEDGPFVRGLDAALLGNKAWWERRERRETRKRWKRRRKRGGKISGKFYRI